MIKRRLGGRGRDAELVRMPRYKFWLVSFIVSESLFVLFVWLGFFWPHLTAHGILGQIRAPLHWNMHPPGTGRTKSEPLGHQGSPSVAFYY